MQQTLHLYHTTAKLLKPLRLEFTGKLRGLRTREVCTGLKGGPEQQDDQQLHGQVKAGQTGRAVLPSALQPLCKEALSCSEQRESIKGRGPCKMQTLPAALGQGQISWKTKK